MKILFLLFAVMPIVEISVLVQVGGLIGGFNTIALVIATAALGAYLVRREGLHTLQSAQSKMQHQEMPGQEIVEGLMLLVAGVLLVTPGFVTDSIGFMLAFPLTRKWMAKKVSAKMLMQVIRPSGFNQQQGSFHAEWQQSHATRQQGEDVIEGEFTNHTPNAPNNRIDR